MSHRVNVLLALMTAVLVGATSACGGERDASADAEPSSRATSASASPSSTTKPAPQEPQVPVLPDEAKPATKAGAEAFGEYFWEVSNYSYFTGDTQPLREISRPDCEACWSVINYLEEEYAKGSHYSGPPWKFVSSEFESRPDPDGALSGTTVADVGPQKMVRPGRKQDRTYPPARVNISLVLFHTGSGWKISYLESKDS